MTEIFQQFHFLRPEWLFAVAPLTVVSWLCWRKFSSSDSWHQVISPQLLPYLLDRKQNKASRSPTAALLATWIIAAVALAGPSWEKQNLPVYQRSDALVVVLDLSLSMYSDDLKPSRLIRARHKLLDILEQRTEGLTALLVYAGDAHIVSPLTDDNDTIANLVPALSPAIMPLPGSNPTAAIEKALSLFQSSTINQGRLLLISDEISQRDIGDIAQLIDSQPFEFSILGVGTTVGAPIPLGNGELLKDSFGSIVIPKLSQNRFEKLADKVGGQYRSISWDNSDTKQLLSSTQGAAGEKFISTDRHAEQWQDSGYWLVFLLLPTSLLCFRRGWLLLLPLWLLPAEQSYAIEWQNLWYNNDQQAARAMDKGDPEKAAELFNNREWSAAANYRAGKFDQAAQVFAEGENADDFYNQGNALAKAGDFEAAIEAYNKALKINPEIEDASFNKELLEKQQQQSQKQQPQQGGQNSEQEGDQQQQPSSSDSEAEEENKPQDSEAVQNQKQDYENQRAESQSEPEQKSKQDSLENPREGETEQQQEQRKAEAAEQKTRSEEQEKQQATEQWLRRIPDDPSGLMRRKFEYESQQRKRNNDGTNNTYW